MENQKQDSPPAQANPLLKPLLTRGESGHFLTDNGFPTTKGNLQKLASVGGGPRYQIFGNKALYRPEDLLRWAESRLSVPKHFSGEGAA